MSSSPLGGIPPSHGKEEVGALVFFLVRRLPRRPTLFDPLRGGSVALMHGDGFSYHQLPHFYPRCEGLREGLSEILLRAREGTRYERHHHLT